MTSQRNLRWRSATLSALVGAAGFLALVVPGSASAASGDHFTCSATAVRAQGLGVVNASLAVANSQNDPCTAISRPA